MAADATTATRSAARFTWNTSRWLGPGPKAWNARLRARRKPCGERAPAQAPLEPSWLLSTRGWSRG